MTKSTNSGKCVVFCFTVVAILLKGTAAECPELTNCDSCPDNVHCETCTSEGVYGLTADRSGCKSCEEESEGTCSQCTSLSHCDTCAISDMGPVPVTDKAMCAKCAPHCQFCQSAGSGKCDDNSCDQGYAKDINQTCSPCSPGCMHCGDYSSCDMCITGKGFSHSELAPQRDCKDCTIENCEECYADNTQCETCKPGFTYTSPQACSEN
jgi:hypothetical protein